MSVIQLRPERTDDLERIRVLTAAAFAGQPWSDGSEPTIIDRLRADGDLTVSLVAVTMDDELVGHIAFSPVDVQGSSGPWYGLGPVSVAPSQQRQGIGSRLIHEGLELLRAGSAHGVALVGDPAYYGRFGFTSGSLSYGGLAAELVQHLVLRGPAPRGTLTYRPAFRPES